jgi:putative ABC transport system substrate-binding protein
MAHAQQSSPVLGVLGVGTEEAGRAIFAPAKARLAELGFVEGKNLTIEYRGANYQADRLAGLAAELVQFRVAAIVAQGGPPTVAAKAATTSIPVVFLTGFDPMASGYVASLSRPGGNLTGVYILNTDIIFKRFEILQELVPTAKTMAFFYTRTADPKEMPFYESLQRAAETRGVNMPLFNVQRVEEIEDAIAKASTGNAEALLVNDHPVFANNVELMIKLAARHKIPALYPRREFPVAGGLASFGRDTSDASRQLGDLLSRVLKGEKPADLPVQQVTKVDMVINTKAAKSLGLTVPLTLLGRADTTID